MTGWAGGIANRTWQRDRRGADSGRINLVRDATRILMDFRHAHGWEPGMHWNPYTATYEHPIRSHVDEIPSLRAKGERREPR